MTGIAPEIMGLNPRWVNSSCRTLGLHIYFSTSALPWLPHNSESVKTIGIKTGQLDMIKKIKWSSIFCWSIKSWSRRLRAWYNNKNLRSFKGFDARSKSMFSFPDWLARVHKTLRLIWPVKFLVELRVFTSSLSTYKLSCLSTVSLYSC